MIVYKIVIKHISLSIFSNNNYGRHLSIKQIQLGSW